MYVACLVNAFQFMYGKFHYSRMCCMRFVIAEKHAALSRQINLPPSLNLKPKAMYCAGNTPARISSPAISSVRQPFTNEVECFERARDFVSSTDVSRAKLIARRSCSTDIRHAVLILCYLFLAITPRSVHYCRRCGYF